MALSRTNYIVSARIDSLQVWYNYIISLISPDLSAPDGPHPLATGIAGPDLPYVHTKYFTMRGGDRVSRNTLLLLRYSENALRALREKYPFLQKVLVILLYMLKP